MWMSYAVLGFWIGVPIALYCCGNVMASGQRGRAQYLGLSIGVMSILWLVGLPYVFPDMIEGAMWVEP